MLKKTILFTVVSAASLGFMSIQSVSAAAYNPNNENVSTSGIDNTLPDNASVLALPDGTYLHGEMTEVVQGSSLKPTKSYNSDTDKKSFTMGELRSGNVPTKSQATPSISVRGVSPATTVKTLGANASIRSEAFTGSGWRFAGFFYQAAAGTGGPYLLWQSQAEDGRVGTRAEANATRNGSVSGTIVGTSVGKYISGVTTYYTYNPIYSPHYVVSNY